MGYRLPHLMDIVLYYIFMYFLSLQNTDSQLIRGGVMGTIRYELGVLSCSHKCSAAMKDKRDNPIIPWLLLIDHANDLRGQVSLQTTERVSHHWSAFLFEVGVNAVDRTQNPFLKNNSSAKTSFVWWPNPSSDETVIFQTDWFVPDIVLRKVRAWTKLYIEADLLTDWIRDCWIFITALLTSVM